MQSNKINLWHVELLNEFKMIIYFVNQKNIKALVNTETYKLCTMLP